MIATPLYHLPQSEHPLHAGHVHFAFHGDLLLAHQAPQRFAAVVAAAVVAVVAAAVAAVIAAAVVAVASVATAMFGTANLIDTILSCGLSAVHGVLN